MPGPHQNMQWLGAGGLYGGNIVGHGTVMPSALSELDAARLGIARTPNAEYPDGYLGTMRSRRDDRLLDATKQRVNQRSYQRGVHKGERIDQSDYYWPLQLQPDRALVNERRGLKTTFVESLVPPPHLPNDGKADVVATEPGRIDQRRAAQLARLMPSWK